MTRFLTLVLLLLLGACATPPPLPTGPWHALNPGKWALTYALPQAPVGMR